MARTPEQVAADDALTAAVEAAARAYGVTAEGELMTSYIVVGQSDSFDLIEHNLEGLVVLYKDDDEQATRLLGDLCSMAHGILLRKDAV